jgi:hypothetical protein
MVDELADFSRVQSKTGDWMLTNHDCRKAKEDAQRAAGMAGDVLIYRVASDIENFRIFTFFPGVERDVKCSISDDGVTYQEIPTQANTYFQGGGEYGYWRPVEFHAEKIGHGRFLKIQLTGDTQVGRIEITHVATP